MSFGDQDLQTFVAEGVPAVAQDGTTANVILEWPEEVDFLHAQMTPGIVVGKPTIQYVTGALALKGGMAITVDGTSYLVCHIWKVLDGKFTKAELNKA
jgi:hypothetical protein